MKTKPQKIVNISSAILAIITLLFFAFSFFYPEIVKRYSYGIVILLWAILILYQCYFQKSFWILIISTIVSAVIIKLFLFDIVTSLVATSKNEIKLAIPIIAVIVVFVIIFWITKILFKILKGTNSKKQDTNKR